jgi:flagellar biosynthesis protein FlhG
MLAGINGDPEMAALRDDDRQKLIDSFEDLKSPIRLLLLDAAAGAGPDITDFALWADELLLVTMPDPTAILDAYGLLKVYHLRGGSGPVGVIVNRVKRNDDYSGIIAALRSTAQGFLAMEIEEYGAVPEDHAATDAISARRPIVRLKPQSPSSKAIRKIADKIRKRLPGTLADRVFRRTSPGTVRAEV